MSLPQAKKINSAQVSSDRNYKIKKKPLNFDPWLLFSTVGILLLGLIMVASTSIVISENAAHQPFYFLIRQIIYMVLGLIAASFVMRVEMQQLQKIAPYCIIMALGLLILVLVPGVGRHVNGSVRWLGIGPLGIQVSEVAKLLAIIYMADYLTRRNEEVRQHVSGFIKPMILFGLMSVLLLREPDFGSAAVIMATALGMMFLAGARFGQFLVLFGAVAAALAALAVSSPYRLLRLTSFLNPWSNEYASGYQLTQSLIAFGRGGWFGAGLGDSVQKLFYLPEAHTDFLFAVLAEELGLIGVLTVVALFSILIWRALKIAKQAQMNKNDFNAYLGYGLALWTAMQAMINIGVNSGLLPTKGLTLPLMSYGGSSMVVMLVVLALLFRIDYETRKKNNVSWGKS